MVKVLKRLLCCSRKPRAETGRRYIYHYRYSHFRKSKLSGKKEWFVRFSNFAHPVRTF